MLLNLYDQYVLKKPVFTLILVGIIIVFFGLFVPDFKLDLSGDSLVLEHDKELKFYRAINARYGTDDYLIITYSPQGDDLFSKETLDDLRKLHDGLAAIDRVESVVSILNAPLLESPPLSLNDMTEELLTLEHPDTDFELAKKELSGSPLYRNRLVGADGTTTALQVIFKRDETYVGLRDSRDALREKQLTTRLTEDELQQLQQFSTQFKRYSSDLQEQEARDIATVRTLIDQHRDKADLHLGGVPMIISDMIGFIKHDIRVFGAGAVLIMLLLLFIIFRQPRWVFLPVITAVTTGFVTVGFLGLVQWRVTVVSSNFLSLLLIFSLSLTIHLIVRYLELRQNNPEADQHQLILETVRDKTAPCFYTVLTTIVAFGSLVVCDIRPVIDFGWIMVIGLLIAFLFTFTLFPAVLVLLKPSKIRQQKDFTGGITRFFARLIDRNPKTVVIVTVIIISLSLVGVTRLSVENRFIDYFKKDTEIFQGMYLIDKKLGGTTPLDVILNPPKDFFEQDEAIEEEPLDDDFDLDLETNGGFTATSYWFNAFMLDEINAVHDYLDSINETGKVLSLSTTLNLLKKVNDNKIMDNFFMAILYKNLPKEVKKSMISPYLSEDGNQLRFSIRIYESDTELKRNALLKKIRRHLTGQLGLADDQVQLTGSVVLFNNLLQSLYRSQVLTLGAVFLAILVMFIFVFRSIWVALIGIVPNIMSASLVLGLMGGLGIPMDIMTITIAAITIGIAVDDTIHYVHRFSDEVHKDGNYREAMFRSHGSIGRAMFYTSITITIGFSILTLSSFVPTIYFGLLTAFAMTAALVANMTILPIMLVKFKPYTIKLEKSNG